MTISRFYQNYIAIILVLFIIASCKQNELLDVSPAEENVVELSQISNTTSLDESNIPKKVVSNLENSYVMGIDSKKKVMRLNLKNARLSSYSEIDVRSITVPLEDNLTFVTYINESNELSDMRYLLQIEEYNEYTSLKYFTVEGKEFAGLIIRDGKITESFIQNDLKKDWVGEWVSCVNRQLKKMTDGSLGGTIYALTCMLAGPECAAVIVVYCAGFATVAN